MADPGILAEQPLSQVFRQDLFSPGPSEFAKTPLPLPNVDLDALFNQTKKFLGEDLQPSADDTGGGRRAAQVAAAGRPAPVPIPSVPGMGGPADVGAAPLPTEGPPPPTPMTAEPTVAGTPLPGLPGAVAPGLPGALAPGTAPGGESGGGGGLPISPGDLLSAAKKALAAGESLRDYLGGNPEIALPPGLDPSQFSLTGPGLPPGLDPKMFSLFGEGGGPTLDPTQFSLVPGGLTAGSTAAQLDMGLIHPESESLSPSSLNLQGVVTQLPGLAAGLIGKFGGLNSGEASMLGELTQMISTIMSGNPAGLVAGGVSMLLQPMIDAVMNIIASPFEHEGNYAAARSAAKASTVDRVPSFFEDLMLAPNDAAVRDVIDTFNVKSPTAGFAVYTRDSRDPSGFRRYRPGDDLSQTYIRGGYEMGFPDTPLGPIIANAGNPALRQAATAAKVARENRNIVGALYGGPSNAFDAPINTDVSTQMADIAARGGDTARLQQAADLQRSLQLQDQPSGVAGQVASGYSTLNPQTGAIQQPGVVNQADIVYDSNLNVVGYRQPDGSVSPTPPAQTFDPALDRLRALYGQSPLENITMAANAAMTGQAPQSWWPQDMWDAYTQAQNMVAGGGA